MTTPNVERDSIGHRRTLLAQLADRRKRFVLGYVLDRAPSSVPVDELATRLAALECDEGSVDESSDHRRHCRIALRHSLWPALDDARRIERVRDGSEIRATDRLSLEAEFVDAVRNLDAPTDVALDDLLDALADRRRRTILSILEERNDLISTRALSRAVAGREEGVPDGDATDDGVDAVHVSLVHVHLPLLRDATLVDYDSESQTVGAAASRSDAVRDALDALLERKSEDLLETGDELPSHSISTYSF